MGAPAPLQGEHAGRLHGEARTHRPACRTCRNQRKKKALADTKTQYNKVTDENRTLLKQLDDTQRENYEVTEYLREELLSKTGRIAQLEAEVAQVRAHAYAHAYITATPAHGR